MECVSSGSERTFDQNPANGKKEPMAVIAFSCCARSQHENRRTCVICIALRGGEKTGH